MHISLHRGPAKSLALALVLVAGCENQITQPPSRLSAGSAIESDKAPFKSVFGLEPLPGTLPSFSQALSINDLGQVVGESSGSNGNRAVIWDNATVPQDLGTLPGDVRSTAAGISNDGRVIAGTSSDANFINHPVRWLKSNGQWLIDPLPAFATCFVNGISSDGAAIAGSCGTGPTTTAVVWLNGTLLGLGPGFANGANINGQIVGANTTGDHALMWTVTSNSFTMKDLGNLGGTFAVAININNAGEVTGWSEDATHFSRAFLWTPRKGMTAVGPAGMTSGGYGINAAGQVVGDMFPTNQHAGFYDHGKVVDLGTLLGYWGSIAHSVNNVGQAVGWSYTLSFQNHAMEWVLK